MTWPTWLVANHVVLAATCLITLGLSRALLRERRPAASTFAWLLLLLFVPYVGIPLYLALGPRKIPKRARGKRALRDESNLRQIHHASRLQWLDDGVSAYQAFLRGIEQAQTSIRIVTFVLGNDEAGRSLIEAMVRRARAGVEVRLLLDDFLRLRAPRDLLAELTRAGGKVERFMPLLHLPFRAQTNLRNHRKIAVFDGERAIVGGMNLALEYLGPTPDPTRWRDLSLWVEGEAARALETIVRADWEFASGEALAASPSGANAEDGAEAIPLTVVPSGPDAATDPIYEALLTAIYRADRSLWISTPYFVPDAALQQAVFAARRRGVDVQIFVPRHSNHALADRVAAPSLRELEAAGAKIWCLPHMLHAKAVCVDGSWGVVGSANFDMRSLFLDYEIVLFFQRPAELERLTRWFDETRAQSELGMAPATFWQRRSEGFAWLLSPLL